MDIGSFLVLALVLSLWGVSAYYMIVPLWEDYLRRRKAQSEVSEINEQLAQLTSDSDSQPLQSRLRQAKHERAKETSSVLVLGAALVVIFLTGVFILHLVLPAWKILALLAGFAAFGGAVWFWRHYRSLAKKWKRDAPPGKASEGGHGRTVLLHLASIAVLPVIGVILIVSIF